MHTLLGTFIRHVLNCIPLWKILNSTNCIIIIMIVLYNQQVEK